MTSRAREVAQKMQSHISEVLSSKHETEKVCDQQVRKTISETKIGTKFNMNLKTDFRQNKPNLSYTNLSYHLLYYPLLLPILSILS